MKICLFFIAALATLLSTGWTANLKMVCYYSSWASYRDGDGKFTSENIDPSICTHVIYAYTGVGSDGGIQILDNYLALPDNYGKDDFKKFVEMKRFNPNMKMMIGIGGFNEGSTKFSRMASSLNTRQYFIRSVINFMNTYRFDGLSVDWMYPGGQGGSATDKENFVLLLQELKQAFNPSWVLSIVGSANEQVFDRGYDVPGIAKYVDFVSLLSFDFHGSWESVTGLNAPLYPRRSESGDHRKSNQAHAVNMWMSKGMIASKLVLGIPTYGRSFTLQDISRTAVGAPSLRPGQQGPYTKLAGTLGYNELLEYFRQQGNWVLAWDDDAKAPFAHRGDLWVSYDDPKSVGIKANYILQNGLGGAMVWSLETDDFRGRDGKTFGLTRTVKEILASGTSGTWTTTTESWKPPTHVPWTPPVDPITWKPDEVTWKPDPNHIVCTRAGELVKDPTNCSRYYVCQDGGNGFVPVLSHCPESLGFDERIQGCDYKDNIPGCRNY